MYLKRERFPEGDHYILSESYRAGAHWTHRRLVDLGTDPGGYFEYPGGNSFYVADSLLSMVRDVGAVCTADELEDLLMPFLDPEIRRIVQRFDRRRASRNGTQKEALTRKEILRGQRAAHDFDKRRIHYLRCGRVDTGDLDGRPLKSFTVLFDKSRDEIEALLEEMERSLPSDEVYPYLYTALNLQTHFGCLAARHHPTALDPERVDECVVAELCRLNQDDHFFRGVDLHDPDGLHPYLIRYLVLFFDTALRSAPPRGGGAEQWMGHRRSGGLGRGPGPGRFSAEEKVACRRLGISLETFQAMDRFDLLRCYRQRVMETHPDRGGDSEEFVKVQQAYEHLVRRKP